MNITSPYSGTYFDKRVKYVFNTYFKAHGLNVKYKWYRIEFQARGTFNRHGC